MRRLLDTAFCSQLWDVPFDGDMGYLGPIAMHSGLKTVTSDRPDDPKVQSLFLSSPLRVQLRLSF